MKSFLMALQFLTPLSIGKASIVKDEDLAKSMAYFTAVGLLAGLILALTYFLLSLLLPTIVVSAIVVLLAVVLSRGLHLDGMADTVDGLAGGEDKNNILRIMHDPHIGAIGAAAIFLALIIKFGCIYSFSSTTAYRALIVSSVLSRWSFVFSAVKWPAAPDNNGLGRKFIEFAGAKELFWSSLTALVVVLFAFGLKGIFIFGLVILLVILFNNFIKGKISGLTGDTLGATGELAELFTLLTGLAIIR